MRARILSLLCLLCASTLLLTSCANIVPPAVPVQNAAATFLYAASYTTTGSTTGGAILSFPTAYSGTVTAAQTTTIASNTVLTQICSDGAGKLYSVSYTSGSPTSIKVNSYNIPNLGNVSTTGVLPTTPTRSFPYTLASNFASMAADVSGNVYISQANGTLLVFPSTATNSTNNIPTVTLALSNSFPAMTTDSTANLYVAAPGGVINKYASGFTTSTPANTFTISASTTNVTSLAVDPSNNIYVLGTLAGTTTPAVFEFPPVPGTATPSRTISGSATGFNTPGAIAVDKAGNVYVEDFSTVLPNQNDFLEFISSASGNTAPIVKVTSSATSTLTTGYGLAAY